jgi:hypothetical protein
MAVVHLQADFHNSRLLPSCLGWQHLMQQPSPHLKVFAWTAIVPANLLCCPAGMMLLCLIRQQCCYSNVIMMSNWLLVAGQLALRSSQAATAITS